MREQGRKCKYREEKNQISVCDRQAFNRSFDTYAIICSRTTHTSVIRLLFGPRRRSHLPGRSWHGLSKRNYCKRIQIISPSLADRIAQEWPVCLLGWRDKTNGILDIVSEFRTFVKPTWRPGLSEFCTRLTGITQV